MRFLIIVALGLAASEKLDRIYLPPPGAKLSGGSPGSIQVPLELPKETYQPTGTLVSENGLTSIEKLPYGYGINRAQFDQAATTQVPSSYYVENVPTTSTSYAFSQTATLPTEGYGTKPVGSITGLPNQYTTKIPNNFGFIPIPEKKTNTNLSSFSQNELQNFPSFNIAGQPQTDSQFVNNAQKDYVNSNHPLGQYQKTAIPIGSTQTISASPKQKNQSLIQFPERQLFFNQSTIAPEINAFTTNYPQNTSNFQSQSPYYDVNIASNSPTATVNSLDSFPGQRSETQNLQPSYSQNDYPVGISSQQYPGINEFMSYVPGNIKSSPLLPTEYYIKPSYSSTTPLPAVAPTVYPISSNYVRPERPQGEADRNAIILNFNNILTPNGYSYSYDTSNGIHADETGVIDNGTKASGGYSYIGDDGKNYSITYTADENGFQPHGDHLPTPPPIPAAIQKIIEQVAMEEAAGISDDGSYDDKKYGDYKYQEYSNRYNVPNRGYDGLDQSEYIGMTRDYGRKPISNINDVISNTQNTGATHEQKKNNLILNEKRLVNKTPERKVKDLSQGLVGQDKREELISSPGGVTSTSFNDVSVVQPTSDVNKQHIDSSKRKGLTTTRYSDEQDSIPDSTFAPKESISNIDLNKRRFDTNKLTSIQRTSSVIGEQSEKYDDNTGYIYNRPQISLEQNTFPNRLRAQETTMIKPFMTPNVNNNKNDAKSSFAFRKPLDNFDVLSPSKESIHTDITDNSNDQPKDKSVNSNRFSSARFPTKTVGTTSGPSKYFKQTLSKPFQYSINNQETAVSKGTPGTNKSDLLKSYTTPMPLQSPQFREETSLKLSKNQNPSSITGLPGSKNKLISVVTSKSELNPQSFRPNEYISSNPEPGSLAVSNSFRMASENRIIPKNDVSSTSVSLSSTPIPASNINSALMNPVSYRTAYQDGNLELQPSYDAATSRPSLSIPSGFGMYSEVAPGSTYQSDYQYRPIDYSLIKGPETLVPNFEIPQSSQANPIVTYPTKYQYGPALSTTNKLVPSDPRKGTVQSYSTTTYKPNISFEGTQAPGITTDNFGRPINSGGISYPGYSAQNSELSSDQSDGSAINQDYSSENVPRTFDSVKYSDYVTTERVAGEDFSGPKQRQNFDPETGYHYK